MFLCIAEFLLKLVYKERIKRGDSPRGSSYNIKIMDEPKL
jgi:hypothetical protein